MTDIRVAGTARVTAYSGGTARQAERKTMGTPHRRLPSSPSSLSDQALSLSESDRQAYGGARVAPVAVAPDGNDHPHGGRARCQPCQWSVRRHSRQLSSPPR
jgi:hypothetical protein